MSIATALWVISAAAVAHAQEEIIAEAAPAADQEIGAALGAEIGGRVSPGGLHLTGGFLYRLSESDWLDSSVSFTFGSGAADCFRDRQDDVVCDHGLFDGFAGEVAVGLRRFLWTQENFTPYWRAGVSVRAISFADDDVRGVATPLWVGGGVRARVAESVVVIGGATVRGGPGFFNRGLGVEPHVGLAVHAGVEFAL